LSIASRSIFDVEHTILRITEIKALMTEESVWSNPKKSKELGKELRILEDRGNMFHRMVNDYDEIALMVELLEEEHDDGMKKDLENAIKVFRKHVQETELKSLLNDENDINGAYLEIHPGAGGTESQDWASMLVRMYQMWGEKRGYGVSFIDYQDGDEAGVKSATIHFKGDYAYGYLKSEMGVHRLVRISPFDSNKRRHTSFTSVYVYPEVEDDIEIEISEKDLRIDTYRASGAGGQHVNRTDSAVRITHIPTNVVVQCQNERSQTQNKDQAMKMLRARLFQLEVQKRDDERTKLEGSKKDISWGSQIRSYVLHPYKMIKDHRTDVETGNIDPVLDGELDDFINGYLDFMAKQK